MKKYLVLLMLVFIFGCKDNALKDKPFSDYTIVIIDGCEYIKTTQYVGFVLTHKANCKNPIHVYKENYVWHIDRFVPSSQSQTNPYLGLCLHKPIPKPHSIGVTEKIKI